MPDDPAAWLRGRGVLLAGLVAAAVAAVNFLWGLGAPSLFIVCFRGVRSR